MELLIGNYYKSKNSSITRKLLSIKSHYVIVSDDWTDRHAIKIDEFINNYYIVYA